MLGFLRKWQQKRIIKRSLITDSQWNDVFSKLSVLDRLSEEEQGRLRELAILFLEEKSFSGAQGIEITEAMKLIIALQACLPILNLGFSWYSGWSSIIIYPGGFMPERTEMDQYGVMHRVKRALSGEAWQRGPVILSWPEAARAGELDGHNLMIHEFVHKLDMLNGVANGFPPLHSNMEAAKWVTTFTEAFDDFQSKIKRGKKTDIDRYGATSPAEFIAVLSELFFEKPNVIYKNYPEVYEKLTKFFRQKPLT